MRAYFPEPKTYLGKEVRRYEANRQSAPHNPLTTFGSESQRVALRDNKLKGW